MPLSVIIYLDEKSDRIIRSIWKALYEGDVTTNCPVQEASPHISLAQLEETDPEKIKSRLKAFALYQKPVCLNFSHVGIFFLEESILFLAPTVTR